MKIYTITLHTRSGKMTMPYYFTNYKEAVLYGEYIFREVYGIEYYEIRNCFKPYPYYKLK